MLAPRFPVPAVQVEPQRPVESEPALAGQPVIATMNVLSVLKVPAGTSGSL